LPGRQRELAEAVLATGAPVVAIIASGRPLTAPWLIERARATVATWFLGDMAGRAIADVLTGRVNPSSRLAVTWPREVGQVPIFYASRSTGRPPDADNPFTSRYLDLPTAPLFPFGHGLSYSRVELTNLRVDRNEFHAGENVEVAVDATNVGGMASEETIFLFIHDLVASVARPTMELKAWAKAMLAPGETKTVAFALSSDSFCFPGEDLVPVIEPGEFDILVGLNADRANLLSARVLLRNAAGVA